MAATFKSIRAVVPLLDRVLVQRFKPEQVRILVSANLSAVLTCFTRFLSC